MNYGQLTFHILLQFKYCIGHKLFDTFEYNLFLRYGHNVFVIFGHISDTVLVSA